MHTILVVSSGLVLLGLFILAAHFISAIALAVAVKAFLLIWLVVSLLNLWGGVAHGGYPLLEELPVLLLVFGIPSVLALIVQKCLTFQ